MSTNKIFTLTNFTPIGFKEVNYPVQFCSLCRGRLADVCSLCIERGSDTCNVINNEGSYYHFHCHSFINTENKKTSVKAKKYTSDSDSD
ncbi:hypothetical protein QJ856_gp1161 [Tupanvirus deep ocean]|uniref:Uncharacterized protein n=2 Tax=Tupanvirus TaxID=2094720 RepID=A0AC62A7E1_9VIRU|nr:hypothetical protein QJ856_gp1161 [Tupanvirus deep ocean]QKU33598.1 hypothetical protein [Tupanvirus deep ocean]